MERDPTTGELALLALEARDSDPRRCVLWVVVGAKSIAMWDLFEPGQEPTCAAWRCAGSIERASSIGHVERLLDYLVAGLRRN